MPQGPFNTLVSKIMSATGSLASAFSAMATDKQYGLLTSGLHGEKYQQAYQSNLYWGANSAGVTMSNGLATTYLGICLSNPAASTMNLAVRRVTGSFVVVPGAVGSLGLISGYAVAGVVTHTTPLTIHASMIGVNAPTPQGKLDSACTIVGTPAWTRQLAVSASTGLAIGFREEIDGGIILQPGSYLAVGSVLAAGPTSGFFGSIEWEEVAP